MYVSRTGQSEEISSSLLRLSELEEHLNTQCGAQKFDHNRAITQCQAMALEHQADIKRIEQAVQVYTVCVKALKATNRHLSFNLTHTADTKNFSRGRFGLETVTDVPRCSTCNHGSGLEAHVWYHVSL